MIKYVLTTESGSDLTDEIINRYQINVVPMHVTMGEQTYPDGSFEVEKVFDYYNQTGNLPKTAGSTPQDFTDTFTKIFTEHPDAHIIHLAYSAVTTVSFTSATIAAKDFDNVHVIDTKHLTLSAAAVVKATAQFIEDNPNESPESILKFIREVGERTQMVFMPKTLLYLKAGGRVSSLAVHGATLLRLCPTITLENGYLVPGKKYRGTFERCLKKMINDFFDNYELDLASVLIGSPPGIEDAFKEEILAFVRQRGVQDPKWITSGAVISSYGGPGAVVITGISK